MMDYHAFLGSMTHQSLPTDRWSLLICKGFFLRSMDLETPDNKEPLNLYDFLKERADASQMFYSKIWVMVAPN